MAHITREINCKNVCCLSAFSPIHQRCPQLKLEFKITSHSHSVSGKHSVNVSGLYINIILFADQTSFVKPKPGIRFTEKMVGTSESSNSKGKQMPCEFTLTIESDDVERMLNCDPSHSAKISGTVTCLALSPSPQTVSDGMCTAAVVVVF